MRTLLCDASGERGRFGIIPILDNLPEFTVLSWLYPTTLYDWRNFITKTSASISPLELGVAGNSAGVRRMGMNVNYSGTSCYYNGDYVVEASKWNYCVWGFNENASANDFVHLYHGGLNTPAVQSAINYNDDPTGTRDTDTGAEWTLGDSIFASSEQASRYGLFALYDRRLTHGEIIEQQKYLTPVLNIKPLVFSLMGADGNTIAMDISGNNFHGTIESATLDDAMPPPGIRDNWAFVKKGHYPTAPAAVGNPWYYYAQQG